MGLETKVATKPAANDNKQYNSMWALSLVWGELTNRQKQK